MTEILSAGEFDPTVRLDHARQTYSIIKNDLLNIVTSLSNGSYDKETLGKMTTGLVHFQKALLQVQSLEADLETRGILTRSTRATTLDLVEAKTEIHRRLAHIKERG